MFPGIETYKEWLSSKFLQQIFHCLHAPSRWLSGEAITTKGLLCQSEVRPLFMLGIIWKKIPFVVKNQHKGGFHCFLFFYVTLSGMEMKRQPMAPRKTTESDVDDGLKRNLKRSVRICLLSSVRPVLALDRRAGPFLPPGELGGRPEWNRSLRLPAFFPSLEGVS